MPLLNDEPTLVDRLDRIALVMEVGDAIATCHPPQVFGIHGDWGLGKTSFLHQVQWYLTGECPQQTPDELKTAGRDVRKQKGIPKGKYKNHVTVVWFEAWRYQHDDVPVVALLQENSIERLRSLDLQWLDLSGTRVTDEQVKLLKAVLPKIKILN